MKNRRPLALLVLLAASLVAALAYAAVTDVWQRDQDPNGKKIVRTLTINPVASTQALYSGPPATSFQANTQLFFNGENVCSALNGYAVGLTYAAGGIIEDSASGASTYEIGSYGAAFSTNASGTKDVSTGVLGEAYHAGAGTVSQAIGVGGYVQLDGTGAVTDAVCLEAVGFSDQGAGTIANGYGVYVAGNAIAGQRATNAVGVAINAQDGITNETDLLIGTVNPPAGTFSIYDASSATSRIAGTMQFTTLAAGGITKTTAPNGALAVATAGTDYPATGVVAAGSCTNCSATFNANGQATAFSTGSTPAPVNATFIVKTPDATLTNEFAMSTLATGMVKNTTTTGVPSIGVAGTDYSAGTSALGTGILKSTTGTGALSIASSVTDYQLPITAGTGLSFSPATTLNIANTAVVAGSYAAANITVDAQGRLTSAASSSSGGGGIASGFAASWEPYYTSQGQTALGLGAGAFTTYYWGGYNDPVNTGVPWATVLNTGTSALNAYKGNVWKLTGSNVQLSEFQAGAPTTAIITDQSWYFAMRAKISVRPGSTGGEYFGWWDGTNIAPRIGRSDGAPGSWYLLLAGCTGITAGTPDTAFHTFEGYWTSSNTTLTFKVDGVSLGTEVCTPTSRTVYPFMNCSSGGVNSASWECSLDEYLGLTGLTP